MTLDDSPLISVLMNCFNGERYLRGAIQSALNQSYDNWELVFWDNQSTDKSAEIFKSYQDPRLKYFYAPSHTGLGDARRAAITRTKGSWVGLLDVDDIWCKGKLEFQVNIIKEAEKNHKNLGLVYGRVFPINDDGRRVGDDVYKLTKGTTLPQGEILKKLLLEGNFIINPSILFKRSAFDEVGGFPCGYLNASDYYLSCAISSRFEVGVVNEYVAAYRIHGGNLSKSQTLISLEEQLLVLERWAPVANLPLCDKKRRTKYLVTLLSLNKLRFPKYFIEGFIRSLSLECLPTAISIIAKLFFKRISRIL